MRKRTTQASATVHLRIGRLIVDDSMLGATSSSQFAERMQAELAAHLPSETLLLRTAPELAGQISNAISARLTPPRFSPSLQRFAAGAAHHE
jgi:hypothetical protein